MTDKRIVISSPYSVNLVRSFDMQMPSTKKLGLVINPIAGLGGRVGLKGTDGAQILQEAKQMGASPESSRRALEALGIVAKMSDELELFAYPYEMGENAARDSGFTPKIVGSIRSGNTTSEDTMHAARDLKEIGVDLLLFVGGDGTARDIYRAIGTRLTVLGIPAGVKMYSAVFGTTPRNAGEASLAFLRAESPSVVEGEVMDIDEASFRRGKVVAKLFGYLMIPEQRKYIQSVKSGGLETQKQVVKGITSELQADATSDCLYVYGPGTTTRDILSQFGLEKTLLGVDVVLDNELIATDVNERELIRLIGEHRGKAKIVVTVIGKQGYIFGRGNRQFSPEVLKQVGRENVIIVASKEKLATLEGRPLLVDTGSDEVDRMLNGYTKVITGYNEYVVYKIAS